jgi:hypothetical protein
MLPWPLRLFYTGYANKNNLYWPQDNAARTFQVLKKYTRWGKAENANREGLSCESICCFYAFSREKQIEVKIFLLYLEQKFFIFFEKGRT